MSNNTTPAPITGYKVFNPDFTCRAFKFEVGQQYKHEGKIEPCRSGFHFCKVAVDCFNYYQFDSNNIVCEVEAIGLTIEHEDKTVTDHIHIKRQLSWAELLTIVNTGKDNTGKLNTGDRNTGDRNTGDRNTGHSNTGHSNTGDRNTGHSNTGDWNTGHSNTGHSNTGHRNTGDSNTGHSNTGDRNTGHSNTGDWNTGHSNTGDWNSTNYSTGVFNSQQSTILMFNKPSTWTLEDWWNSDARSILSNLVLNKRVWFSDMTDQEKIDHPKAYVTDGYLKTYDYKEACATLWASLDDSQKEVVKALPNFCPVVFEEITGIKAA